MPIEKSIIDQTLATRYGEQAYKLVVTLHDAGYDTWWVGGAVRDMLQGHIPKDIDIGTAATPDQVLELFPEARHVPRPLGSTRVRMGSFVYEVTTFREESDLSDGRIPESITYAEKEADAKRRDFTINALYFNPISSELYDPFHGEADLREKMIEFIGSADDRIKHDALRIMRAIRFKAKIDGQYHPDTYTALRKHAALVANLSGIRKLEELEKLLLTDNAEHGLEDMWELDVLQHVSPSLYACKGMPQPAEYHHEGDVWNHVLRTVSSFTDEHGIDARLAALFHDVGKTETFSQKERIRFDSHAEVSAELAGTELGALGISNKRKEKICWIIEHHMMMGSFINDPSDDPDQKMSDERKAHWYFHPWFPELLQLFWLDIAGTDPSDFTLYDTILADYHAFLDSHPAPQKPYLTGDEIMKLTGLKPSGKVGDLIEELRDAQVRKEVNSKKEAEAFIQKLYDQDS